MNKNTHSFYVVDINVQIAKFVHTFAINNTSISVKKLPLKDYLPTIITNTEEFNLNLNSSYKRSTDGYIGGIRRNGYSIHPDYVDSCGSNLQRLMVDRSNLTNDIIYNIIKEHQIPDLKFLRIAYSATEFESGDRSEKISIYLIKEDKSLQLISGIDIVEEMGNKEEVLNTVLDEIF